MERTSNALAAHQHIALVTGGNRGIGLQVVKSILEEKGDHFVFMGCRDIEQGTALAKMLSQMHGERVEAVQLNVTDKDSIAKAVETIAAKTQHLDSLVNNAGILLEADGAQFSMDAVYETMRVNFGGVAAVTAAFLPMLLRSPVGGQVLSTSSGNGTRAMGFMSEDHRLNLMDTNLNVASLQEILGQLVEGLKDPNNKYHCIPQVGYGLSKMGVNCLTQVLSRQHPTLRINACSPGFCNTDMCANYTGQRKPKDPTLGASVFRKVLFGELGQGKTGSFFKENSKADTPVEQAVSVLEDWVALPEK
jgi:NAD(P)-dependent dehydrogenase (short-subunit alcohol dehydrogenase family)